MKRRQVIEPVIGHVKEDCRMRRWWLKGAEGDATHAIACAVGYNIRWLLGWIALLRAWWMAMPERELTLLDADQASAATAG